MKKVLTFLISFSFVIYSAGYILSEPTTVNGELMFYLYDQSRGESNGKAIIDRGTIGFTSLLLLISKEINEKVFINIEPQFDATTGATPKLGTDIGQQRVAPSKVKAEFFGINKAMIKCSLPNGFELASGILRPLFTEDYGAEQYFHEEYNGSKVSCNPWLGSWHDIGLELYKGFEINKISLPVWFYLMNGGNEYTDNNQNKTVMIHITPEFSNLRLIGSIGYGKWDDKDKYDMVRWVGGLEYKWQDFVFRAEYMEGVWRHMYCPQDKKTIDAKPWGYYMKLSYRILPWLSAMVNYNLAVHNFSGFFYTGSTIGEKYLTITPVLNFLVFEDSYLMFQYDIADWEREDGNTRTKFNRITLGWKTLF